MAHGKIIHKQRFSKPQKEYQILSKLPKEIKRKRFEEYSSFEKMEELVKMFYMEEIETYNKHTKNDRSDSPLPTTALIKADQFYLFNRDIMQHLFLETNELYQFLINTKISTSIDVKEIFDEVIGNKWTILDEDSIPSSHTLAATGVNLLPLSKVVPETVGLFDILKNAKYKFYSSFIHIPGEEYSPMISIKISTDENNKILFSKDADIETVATNKKNQIINQHALNKMMIYSLLNYICIEWPRDSERTDCYILPLNNAILNNAMREEKKENNKKEKHNIEIASWKQNASKALHLVFNLFYYIHAFPQYFVNGTPDPRFNSVDLQYILQQRNNTINVNPELLCHREGVSSHSYGDGSSKCPHFRSGHFRTLRDERYTKARFKTIWVNSTFIHGSSKTALDSEEKTKIAV
jgi:hypothetical protein